MAQEFAERVYASKEWRELRHNLIVERKPICQRCNTYYPDTSKLIGHHKIELNEINVNDPNIVFNPDNIEIICSDCHNKEHRRFNGKSARRVYIVYGPPLSGKHTLVNQLATYGDLILDIDSIYQCLGGQTRYNNPSNLRFNMFGIRDKILDMVRTRYGEWYDAYIIGGYPSKAERDRLQRELRAEIIYCEATKEDCYQRLKDNGRGTEWGKYIDKWFEEYS
ncbi:MAG: HNH endonuclease [Cellulosilyticaceae bacterium]